MAAIKVSIVNAGTLIADSDAAQAVAALQKQVHRDFAPAWGISADLSFVPRGERPDPATWWLAILDNSDQAGALGYHDLTPSGSPMGKVFAGSDIQYHTSWTVTLSHEMLELLADPNVNLTVFDEGPLGARLYAYEVCDACEDDRFGYEIDGVLLSDFVLPSWFESFRQKGSTDFDFRKHINEPFELLPGGYIGVNDLASGIGWNQILADASNPRAQGAPGSRRQRRTVLPSQRTASVLIG